MHGGVKFYRGCASAARSYVEANRSRAIRIKIEDLEATPRQIPSARW